MPALIHLIRTRPQLRGIAAPGAFTPAEAHTLQESMRQATKSFQQGARLKPFVDSTGTRREGQRAFYSALDALRDHSALPSAERAIALAHDVTSAAKLYAQADLQDAHDIQSAIDLACSRHLSMFPLQPDVEVDSPLLRANIGWFLASIGACGVTKCADSTARFGIDALIHERTQLITHGATWMTNTRTRISAADLAHRYSTALTTRRRIESNHHRIDEQLARIGPALRNPLSSDVTLTNALNLRIVTTGGPPWSRGTATYIVPGLPLGQMHSSYIALKDLLPHAPDWLQDLHAHSAA